jgi:hypothetical protein
VPIFELTKNSLVPVATTTFAAEHIRERYDLQRVLRDNIGAIAPETLVLAEEYGEWRDSRRRIDLLCLDKDASLVVVELKRTEDGGHMELQAIRYAAMVSKMTFAQAVEAHSRYLGSIEKEEEAKAAILTFLDWDEPKKEFAQEVRVILISSEFSIEITTSVLWLNESGLDIRCVSLSPYALNDRVLLDIQQVLPLREAEEYQVQIRKKAAEERLSEGSGVDRTRYEVRIADEAFPHQTKRGLIFRVVSALIKLGVTPEQIMEIFPRRKFLTVRGTFTSPEEFADIASNLRSATGATYDLGRFFAEKDELFHVAGNTYALSNQWSKGSMPYLERLIARYPQAAISFKAEEEGS